MELRMSQKERDRLKLMKALKKREIGQKEAGEILGIGQRQVRRLLRRYEADGDAGLVHRARGRPSNRAIADAVRERAVACIREQYRDFGPTLVAETLAEREGIQVSAETVRRWMIDAGLWKARRARVRHRQWRQRRACVGELVQMDTSMHAWFEGRAEEEPVLIAMADDATNRLEARFFPTDSTRTNLAMLDRYIRRHGRPVALYADRASHFICAAKQTVDDQLHARESETQIGRALRQLEIRYIPANSPQAKGRIERNFKTLQDRLVKDLRLHGISTLEEANAFLDDVFLPFWNQRFAVAPAGSVDAHRPRTGFDLDAILSVQENRTVQNDYTVRFQNHLYQIDRKSCSRGLRQAKVTVEHRLDGSVHIRFRGRRLHHHRIPDKPPVDLTACGQGQPPPCPQALDNSLRKFPTTPQAQAQ